MQAQDRSVERQNALAAIATLAGTAECAEAIASAALPALLSMLQDTSNPGCSTLAADTIGVLAASPALLPGIKQDLSGHVIPGLVASLKVRAVQPLAGSVQAACMVLLCPAISQ